METNAAWNNASYKGSMSSYGGTIDDDPSIPYYARAMGNNTARYPTDIEKEQERNPETSNDDNNKDVIDKHVTSKSVSNITNSG